MDLFFNLPALLFIQNLLACTGLLRRRHATADAERSILSARSLVELATRWTVEQAHFPFSFVLLVLEEVGVGSG